MKNPSVGRVRAFAAAAILAGAWAWADSGSVSAQWVMEDSHTTADLRGIDNVGHGVAWASGTQGTVLRTLDGGTTWQPCAVPHEAAKLDFRGVQAFDADSAIVMSSGPGEASRLYKTSDGCKSWRMVFADPDEKGFFDSLRRVTAHQIYLLGDPVGGKFSVFYSPDAGEKWYIADDPGLDAEAGDGVFAASNSSLIAVGPFLYFGTGGGASAHVFHTETRCPAASSPAPAAAPAGTTDSCPLAWVRMDIPLATGSAAAGVFSLASRNQTDMGGRTVARLVAVGGVYDKPESTTGTAAYSTDNGKSWRASAVPPGGYRSAVAFEGSTAQWIAVGPNGTDRSADEGKSWRALQPAAGDAPGADKQWNALSLPFVVGPKGRIGRLRDGALAAR